MGRASLQAGAGRAVAIGPTQVGARAYEAGLDRNDQITALDGKPVTQPPTSRGPCVASTGDSIVVAFVQRGSETSTAHSD